MRKLILALKSPSKASGTIRNSIRALGLKMLTKVKPKSNSNFEPKIRITAPNLILTTFLDQFSHSEADGIDGISFRDLNLQMTKKFKN